ncbi:chaplin [Streptomyces sp. NPDC096040]|uniref:chaplin n=1 Tax=Streptomyces sp. NPDC096040 TaxID=3155541 RepID=UPI00332FEFEA
MNRATRNSVIAFAVASGAMAVAGPAWADSAADGSASGSPGLVSGNDIQLPVNIPVNVCGNTVDVIGLLNPAMGNRCVNGGGKDKEAKEKDGAAAVGSAHDSPGVLSGNGLQLPVDVPLNVIGNSVNAVGIGNPVFGNEGVNTPDHPDEPARSTPPQPVRHQPSHPAKARPMPKPPATVVRQRMTGTLAHTGTGNPWAPAAASLASLTAGVVLYRRFRPRTVSHVG